MCAMVESETSADMAAPRSACLTALRAPAVSHIPRPAPHSSVATSCSRAMLPIQLRRDDVDRTEHGDHVAHHVPLEHHRDGLVVDVAARPRAGTPGDVFAGGDDVIAQLAVGGFDAAVDFALGDAQSAVGHDQLEVLNQTFDTAVDLFLRWED